MSGRDIGWLSLSAVCGAAWGLLMAWLESSGAPLLFLLGGAAGGAGLGLFIRPYRDADDRTSLVLLSLLAVYAAGAFYGALTGLRGLAVDGVDGAASVLMAPVGQAFVTCWALTLSGVFLALWPIAAANIVVVWRLQRRATAYSPGL